MTKHPIISVIIPVWNGADRIGATLDALANQSAPRETFEVIAVDNGSTDATAEVIGRHSDVVLLSEPQPGSYRARNLGLAKASGEFVLFTDGDCVPDRDWVSEALSVIKERPDAGLYAGQVTLFREAGAGPFSARYEELTAFNQEGNVRSGHCVTANWLCMAKDLRAIGGFNSDLLSGGDIDCSRRMVAAGHELIYAPDMIVQHPTRANLIDLMRKRRRVVGGRWHLKKKQSATMPQIARLFTTEAMSHANWTIRGKMETWAKPGVVAIIFVLLLTAQYELWRQATGRPPYRS